MRLFRPAGLPSPPAPRLELETPGAAGQCSGKGSYWLCQDFTAQAGSQPDSPGSWEKGPDHFPRPARRSSDCPPRKEGTAGPLVSPPGHPGALGSPRPWWGQGPASPPMASSAGFPLHQARSEVLGAPAWSWGLDPDHKARDPPGISGKMLLAKPPGLQGPERKPPSFPVASLPPPRQTLELESGTAQPD